MTDSRWTELIAAMHASRIDVADLRLKFEKTLRVDEQLLFSQQQADVGWTDLLLGRCTCICYPQSHQPKAIFAGAFNPPHVGHQRIAAIAAGRLGHPVAYELSITNVDKPPLDLVEIDRRLKQLQSFDPQTPIMLTNAPTFCVKATLFPGCTFVVGVDTIARIADPKYYRGEATGLGAAIQLIADRECRFLVFGRQRDGEFQTLGDLTLPAKLRELCDEVSAEAFREDVSSSEVRNGIRRSES